MDSLLSQKTEHVGQSSSRVLCWVSILVPILLYFFQFLSEDGLHYISPDGQEYLAAASGQIMRPPINTRVLAPFIASTLAHLTGLSLADAFRALTPIEFVASLLLLMSLLRRRGGTREFQASVLLAFGCAFGAIFGHAPVLIDPLVLLLTCLTIEALDRERFAAALVFASLATLTKEYCVFLGLVWAIEVYRRRNLIVSFAGVLPVVVLALTMRFQPAEYSPGLAGLSGHLQIVLGWQKWILSQWGPVIYAKALYIWSWAVLWPLFLIAILAIVSGLRKTRRLTRDQLYFVAVSLAIPVLLLGDWDRSLLIAVPFASMAAMAHPLAKDRKFILLLAVGGVSTAVARPLYSVIQPPRIFLLMLIAASVISSILVAVTIGRFYMRTKNERAKRRQIPVVQDEIRVNQ